MKNSLTLPGGYRPFRIVDFKRDNRLSLKVNFIAVGLCLLLYVLAFKLAPRLGASLRGFDQFSIPFVVVGAVVYYVLHELIHGLAMGLLCKGCSPKFRAYGLLAYVGNQAFYTRDSYLLISFAPILAAAVVLAAIVLVLGAEMYWSAALLMILNLASAAGDIYVAYLMYCKMPGDTMVQDLGVTRIFFSASKDVEALPLKKL